MSRILLRYSKSCDIVANIILLQVNSCIAAQPLPLPGQLVFLLQAGAQGQHQPGHGHREGWCTQYWADQAGGDGLPGLLLRVLWKHGFMKASKLDG